MTLLRPKIGLALGSGGPKGLAHIGVLKVLEKHNIPIDYIAGSSAGSIAGGFYAARKNVKEIEDYLIDKNWIQMLSIFLDPSFKQGVLRGVRLRNFLSNYLGEITFSKLKIPFQAVSVNIQSGYPYILKTGQLVPAILASCGMPFLFSPVELDKQLLVDGALYSPVPVDVVKLMGSDIVIAVNLYGIREGLPKNSNHLSMSHVIERSLSIMAHNLANYDIKKADVIVNPEVYDMRWRDLLSKEERIQAIKAGEESMEMLIPQLKQLIRKKQKEPFPLKVIRIFKHLISPSM